MRKTLVLAAAVALIAAGCGGSSDSTTETEAAEEAANVTPQKTVEEIGEVRKGLAASLAAYRNGKGERADTLAGDAYLQDFELVEGPLGERDEELNEELEDEIRETLRTRIQDGAPVAQVEALIKKINGELDEAERVLGY